MAFTINGNTIPNPVTVDVDSVPLAALNIRYGGQKAFYLTQSTTDLQGIHVLKIAWQSLNGGEMDTVQLAWQYAANGYVSFVFTDLALAAVLGVTDTTQIMVYPGSSLDKEWLQAWDSAGNGPILWDAVATFVTRAERIW